MANQLKKIQFFLKTHGIVQLGCIFPRNGFPRFAREFPDFWKIGEFPVYSPFLFPGNLCLIPGKFFVLLFISTSTPIQKIKILALNSSQRDRSFKPIKNYFGAKKMTSDFFMSSPFAKEPNPGTIWGRGIRLNRGNFSIPREFMGNSQGICNEVVQ